MFLLFPIAHAQLSSMLTVGSSSFNKVKDIISTAQQAKRSPAGQAIFDVVTQIASNTAGEGKFLDSLDGFLENTELKPLLQRAAEQVTNVVYDVLDGSDGLEKALVSNYDISHNGNYMHLQEPSDRFLNVMDHKDYVNNGHFSKDSLYPNPINSGAERNPLNSFIESGRNLIKSSFMTETLGDVKNHSVNVNNLRDVTKVRDEDLVRADCFLQYFDQLGLYSFAKQLYNTFNIQDNIRIQQAIDGRLGIEALDFLYNDNVKRNLLAKMAAELWRYHFDITSSFELMRFKDLINKYVQDVEVYHQGTHIKIINLGKNVEVVNNLQEFIFRENFMIVPHLSQYLKRYYLKFREVESCNYEKSILGSAALVATKIGLT